jgi:hypothetical protein
MLLPQLNIVQYPEPVRPIYYSRNPSAIGLIYFLISSRLPLSSTVQFPGGFHPKILYAFIFCPILVTFSADCVVWDFTIVSGLYKSRCPLLSNNPSCFLHHSSSKYFPKNCVFEKLVIHAFRQLERPLSSPIKATDDKTARPYSRRRDQIRMVRRIKNKYVYEKTMKNWRRLSQEVTPWWKHQRINNNNNNIIIIVIIVTIAMMMQRNMFLSTGRFLFQ